MLPLWVANAAAGTVCPFGCDHTGVAAALADAQPGEIVEILRPGTYDANALVFPDDVTIRGKVPGVVLEDASILVRAAGMAFEHVTIDCNGHGFAGALGNQQSLRLTRVEVRNCSAASGPIATVAHENAQLTIVDSWIHDVSTTGSGLVDMPKGRVTLEYSLICGATAGGDGAVVRRTDEARELVVDHNVFFQGSADRGAAVMNDQNGTMSVSRNTFVGGAATAGGALYLDWRNVDVEDNAFVYTASGDAVAPGAPTGTFRNNGWWSNAAVDVTTGGRGMNAVLTDPGFAEPTVCDPHLVRPTTAAWLTGAVDGGEIGALGGPVAGTAWDDADEDGRMALWDCDDTDPTTSDVAVETDCDGVDNDCNGVVDNGILQEGWVDADGDGFGGALITGCSGLVLVSVGGDCNDADPTVSPGAAEVLCNGVDDDCDSATLDAPDADGDGDPVCTDCDDTEPLVSSLADEVCDGLDNDCNGFPDSGPSLVLFADEDGDGFGDVRAPANSCSSGVEDATDCDDTRADVSPAAPEVCDASNTDEDCNGLADDLDPGVEGQQTVPVDADSDGYPHPTQTVLSCEPSPNPTTFDCDDADPTIHPGAEDIPDDGIDQDCDGTEPAYTYGNGSCGCQATEAPGAIGLITLGLLLGARRRW
ncbi:MAG: putative metal-binding motif-containing protein [Myxococcota bacterium]